MSDYVLGNISFGRSPKPPDQFISVDHVINDAVSLRMWEALKVIATNPKIRFQLAGIDKKALKQVEDAIAEYESSYQQTNIDNI